MTGAARTDPTAGPIDAGEAADAPGGHEVPETDGRRRRRVHNREAAVDALLDIYRDGNLRPSTDEIAERAGLSPRSLFRYFDDVDDLAGAAVARQHSRAAPLLPIGTPPGAPLADKVRALVDQRFRLFDEVGQADRVSRLRSPFQPLLAEGLSQGRAFLRQQVIELFAPELHRMGEARAAASAAAADVMSSFESYQLLRDDQLLTPARAKAVMVEALSAILGTGDPSGDR